MSKSRFEKEQLIPVGCDISYFTFMSILVWMRRENITMGPRELIEIVASGLAENGGLISREQIEEITVGYLAYTLQPQTYNPLLDMLIKAASLADDAKYKSHCLEITKIFSEFMIGAQEYFYKSKNI